MLFIIRKTFWHPKKIFCVSLHGFIAATNCTSITHVWASWQHPFVKTMHSITHCVLHVLVYCCSNVQCDIRSSCWVVMVVCCLGRFWPDLSSVLPSVVIFSLKHADNMHDGCWNVRDMTNVGRHVSERWCSKCCDEHDRGNNGPLGSAITLLLWSSLRSIWKVLLKPIWPTTSCLHHSSTKGCSSKTLAQSSSMTLRNVAMPSFPPILWMVVADFASSAITFLAHRPHRL